LAESAAGIVGTEQVEAALWVVFHLEGGECRPA